MVTYQESGLTRSSPENVCPQSSQLVAPLWTGSCLKSGISAHYIWPLKKKKGGGGGGARKRGAGVK